MAYAYIDYAGVAEGDTVYYCGQSELSFKHIALVTKCRVRKVLTFPDFYFMLETLDSTIFACNSVFWCTKDHICATDSNVSVDKKPSTPANTVQHTNEVQEPPNEARCIMTSRTSGGYHGIWHAPMCNVPNKYFLYGGKESV